MANAPSIEQLIPGGILPTDHWHIGTNDDTCSRCRRPIHEDEVPLMLWDDSRENMLIYCTTCLQGRPANDG